MVARAVVASAGALLSLLAMLSAFSGISLAQTFSCSSFSEDVTFTPSRVVAEVTEAGQVQCSIDNSGDLPSYGIAFYTGPTNNPDTFDFFAHSREGSLAWLPECEIAGAKGRSSGPRCSLSLNLPYEDGGPDHLNRATAIVDQHQFDLIVITRALSAHSNVDILSAYVVVERQPSNED